MKIIRRILEYHVCEYLKGEFWFSFHLLDLINVWKRKNINWIVKIVPRDQIGESPWFQWWTPAWHEERGPYISIGLGRFRFYRGY